ncbi:protein prenylyltransferase [Cylindrobasidium torrendii FP15055 ss-10]|uniref:Protein prenylyltransferase n=1 Tax=Cylindrobasidium torrendii FP15055 ss-10 TaxID=1314674 RepID=A0A0D7BC46_9AGAR|nr:protein prenylyltransferase [Cylindrobasidium torrendii FP15055 ss-10]
MSLELLHLLADSLKSLESIEILPGSAEDWSANPEFPFLLSEGHLGIPQKLLYKLYVFAISVLSQPKLRITVRDIIAATAVIVLANPAHTTALNTRKTLVLSNDLDPHNELTLTRAAILGCKDMSKQSVIWHHRRWLLQHLHSQVRPPFAENTNLAIPCTTLKAELHLIAHACETYPRNYYAWAHRLFCADILSQLVTQQVDGADDIVREEFQYCMKWIDTHLSDYTAMNYACQFANRFPSVASQPKSPHPLLLQAIALLQTYPSHEALWMYLRTCICIESSMARVEMVKLAEESLRQTENSGRLDQCLRYIETFTTRR